MIRVSREKAEAATLIRLRLAREPRLAELDVAFMRAIERGEDTTAIATEKQMLRDVTDKSLDGLTITKLATLTLEEARAL